MKASRAGQFVATSNTIARTCLFALLFAAASCTDSVTGPEPSPAQVVPRGFEQALISGEVIEVTRITGNLDADPSVKAKRYQTTKVITIGHGTISVPGGVLPNQPSTVARGFTPPLPRLSYPPCKSAAKRGQWATRRSYLDEPGAIIEAHGHGDAPATEIKLIRNGVVAMEVKREFRRGETAWELVRQVTTTPDGSLRDVIQVDRSGGLGALSPALSRSSLLSPSPALFDDGADGGGGDGSDVENYCQQYIDDFNSKTVDALIASGEFIAGCYVAGVFPPVEPYACSALAAKAARAVYAQGAAEATMNACEDYYVHIRDAKPYSFVPASWQGMGSGTTDIKDTDQRTCSVYYEFRKDTGEVTYARILWCWAS